MSGMNEQHPKEQELTAEELGGGGGGMSTEELKAVDKSDDISVLATDKSDESSEPSPEQQEETIKKKYGFLPKKPPLISKDHERAFFDSADWALGKGSNKPKGPLEALRPKWQPTPHQQVRRSAYAPADGSEVEGDHTNTSSEGQTTLESGDNNDNGTAA